MSMILIVRGLRKRLLKRVGNIRSKIFANLKVAKSAPTKRKHKRRQKK